MKENVWQEQQHKLGLFTERSVSLLEIKEIHQNLLIQHAAISEEVTYAIERNDYVKLSHLIVNRSKIQTAIKEVESLHDGELNNHDAINDRIGQAPKEAATTMESNLLLNIINTLNKINQSAHMASKATSISKEIFSRGNQNSHQAGKLLIHKTSESLAKFTNIFRKRY